MSLGPTVLFSMPTALYKPPSSNVKDFVIDMNVILCQSINFPHDMDTLYYLVRERILNGEQSDLMRL